MSEELKRCPFCGEQSHYGWGTHKANCYFSYKSDNVTDYNILTKAWQSRPLEDILRAERDLLRQKLEIAIDGLWRIDFCINDKAVAVEILEKIAALNGKNE
jgi:hypothetical protein